MVSVMNILVTVYNQLGGLEIGKLIIVLNQAIGTNAKILFNLLSLCHHGAKVG